MAYNHIPYNKSTEHGAIKKKAIDNLEAGLRGLNDTLAVMAQMIDGDGTQDAHFVNVQARYGYESPSAARSAFNDLTTMAGKLNTNASVTNVKAAFDILFARFR